jgi:hypothetical protein
MYRLAGVVLTTWMLAGCSGEFEPPCDFKGISVGNRMTPSEIMSGLGVTKYKTSPERSSFEDTMAAAQKYGIIPAGELEDWNIGPYCTETYCRVPHGVTVGNNKTAVSGHVSLREGLVTEIDVSFNATFWDEILPIIDQNYGTDWNVDRGDISITDYETRRGVVLERVSLDHISKGTNKSTMDRCQISATNLDIVFQHHDAYGPYHSVFVIKLISKNI